MLSTKATFQYDQLSVHEMLTCVAGLTGTLVAVDLVDAGPIVAGIALAVVNVDFTVDSCQKRHISFSNLKCQQDIVLATIFNTSFTCGALGAAAEVGILSVLAGASVSARLAQTLVDVGLAQSAGVPRVALAAEGRQAIDAGAVVARVRVTLVDVCLTVPARVTWQKSVLLN